MSDPLPVGTGDPSNARNTTTRALLAVGLVARVTNAAERTAEAGTGPISQLWSAFMQQNFLQHIPNQVGPGEIVAVDTDYDSDQMVNSASARIPRRVSDPSVTAVCVRPLQRLRGPFAPIVPGGGCCGLGTIQRCVEYHVAGRDQSKIALHGRREPPPGRPELIAGHPKSAEGALAHDYPYSLDNDLHPGSGQGARLLLQQARF